MNMVSWNIRDLLTSFSPSLDYLAISSGDGRIKIWDTVNGQLQTEFADLVSDDSNWYTKTERGHLSIDYTCLKWLSLDRKKKRKLGSSLLVLGTGSGDVLALDVAAAQLRWTISDCHPGGVTAISFSTHDSCIYTAGADGMVCKIDPQTGNLLSKFRASTKAISCMSLSSDGKTLATAAAQLKIFNCSNNKKIQKFSGHPSAVRSMIFSEDGKYILSSAVGERYVALWRTDGGKKQSAACVLAMENPPVFLDSICFGNEGVDNAGLYVLAISETGVCYTWCGENIEELRNAKPSKVSLSSEESFRNNFKGGLPKIFAAKLQGTGEKAAAHVFIGYGSLVKPMFHKVVVHSGTNVILSSSMDGVLLPVNQSMIKYKKSKDARKVTALDRANVEDALLPIPKVSDLHERSASKILSIDSDEVMADLIDSRNHAEPVEKKDMVEVEPQTFCIEKRLRKLTVLGRKDDGTFEPSDITLLKGIDLGVNIPQRKMRAAVLSMAPPNAYKLLNILVAKWQSRSCSEKYVLQWIHCILVNHGRHIMAQGKPEAQMLSSLLKITKSRGAAMQPLLQLSGRLQLVKAQIDKASLNKAHASLNDYQMDDSEDEDEDVNENMYGDEDDGSQLSSDDN